MTKNNETDFAVNDDSANLASDAVLIKKWTKQNTLLFNFLKGNSIYAEQNKKMLYGIKEKIDKLATNSTDSSTKATLNEASKDLFALCERLADQSDILSYCISEKEEN